MLKIGDKIVCDNGKTYMIGEGVGFYKFAIIDEDGNTVNYYHPDYLIRILDKNEPVPLIVGEDENGDMIYTEVLTHLTGKQT